jgi:hypothetical protein
MHVIPVSDVYPRFKDGHRRNAAATSCVVVVVLVLVLVVVKPASFFGLS